MTRLPKVILKQAALQPLVTDLYVATRSRLTVFVRWCQCVYPCNARFLGPSPLTILNGSSGFSHFCTADAAFSLYVAPPPRKKWVQPRMLKDGMPERLSGMPNAGMPNTGDRNAKLSQYGNAGNAKYQNAKLTRCGKFRSKFTAQLSRCNLPVLANYIYWVVTTNQLNSFSSCYSRRVLRHLRRMWVQLLSCWWTVDLLSWKAVIQSMVLVNLLNSRKLGS